MQNVTVRFFNIFSGLIIQALLLVFMTGQIIYSQDEEHPAWTERYVDSSASPGGNGTIGNPWQSFEEVQISQNWTKINVRPAIYTVSDTNYFLQISNITGVLLCKDSRYPGEVILDGSFNVRMVFTAGNSTRKLLAI
jgi:hypothetical protein